MRGLTGRTVAVVTAAGTGALPGIAARAGLAASAACLQFDHPGAAFQHLFRDPDVAALPIVGLDERVHARRGAG